MHTHAVRVSPTTKLGRWAIALALVFFFFGLVGALAPIGGRLAFLSGVAAGVTALFAFVRGERGLLVGAAIFPLVAVVAFVLAELFFD